MRRREIGGVEVTIAGIAKGAGMIAPDMATMLSFVFTDAPIGAEALQTLLAKGVEPSFNAITVDGDTSTSDTLLLFATGAAAARGAPKIDEANDRRLKAFKKALDGVLLDLAHQVVKDGEGARKFVEITVEGAASKKSAKTIAFSIANSPLVKTAIAGEDANWGRIVMAVGKAGEPADRDRLAIWFGDIRVAHKGLRDPAYDEAKVSALMRQPKIAIRVDLGIGKGERDRMDLRSHERIYRDQRRLSKLRLISGAARAQCPPRGKDFTFHPCPGLLVAIADPFGEMAELEITAARDDLVEALGVVPEVLHKGQALLRLLLPANGGIARKIDMVLAEDVEVFAKQGRRREYSWPHAPILRLRTFLHLLKGSKPLRHELLPLGVGRPTEPNAKRDKRMLRARV